MSIKQVMVKASARDLKPTFTLTEKELPEIKDWKVGKKYTITLDVEQVSAEKGDSYFDEDSSKQLRARFKILKAYCEDEDDED